jgi:hypothetical protein
MIFHYVINGKIFTHLFSSRNLSLTGIAVRTAPKVRDPCPTANAQSNPHEKAGNTAMKSGTKHK